jgi:predicted ATP-grasp superfamily ATP-dependent carboligase
MSNNKWEFYWKLKEIGLPAIPTIFVGKAGEEIDDSLDLDSIEFPALLKPTSQKGGDGIIKVEKSSELKYAWRNERVIKGRQYILQTFIDAERFSLSVCCRDGEMISYTLQHVLIPSKNPYQPGTTVEYVYNEKVLDVGRKLFKAMEWNGIADIDLLIDKRDQTIYVLEFNPRLWQSLLGSLIAGVNIPYIWCLSALGINESCSQNNAVKYTRPASFIKTMLARLIGRRPPVNIQWNECDLQFTVRDFLPELVDIIFKPVIWFRYKCLSER